MASNIEIKASVRDLASLEGRVRELGADGPVDIEQVDVFFRTPTGRLKLRKFADGTGELIQYERADGKQPGESCYTRVPAPEPELLERALADALGVRGTVEKTRRLYLVGETRIHLDRVRDLGSFMELEVVLETGQDKAEGDRIARELMSALSIEDTDLVECAYIDLLEETSGQSPS